MMISIFAEGDVIFRQGAVSTEIYDVLSGSVGIYAARGTEHEKLLATLGPGQIFGERAAIEAYPRSATAVALENDTRLQVIDTEEFSRYFVDQPERLLTIMQQMSDRLVRVTKDYQEVSRAIDDLQDSGRKPHRLGSLLDRIRQILAFYDESAYLTDLESDSVEAQDQYDYRYLY